MNTSQRKAAIERAGRECEKSLRLADFAEHEPAYGPQAAGIARGLRKLAEMESDNAFLHARQLMLGTGGAA